LLCPFVFSLFLLSLSLSSNARLLLRKRPGGNDERVTVGASLEDAQIGGGEPFFCLRRSCSFLPLFSLALLAIRKLF